MLAIKIIIFVLSLVGVLATAISLIVLAWWEVPGRNQGTAVLAAVGILCLGLALLVKLWGDVLEEDDLL